MVLLDLLYTCIRAEIKWSMLLEVYGAEINKLIEMGSFHITAYCGSCVRGKVFYMPRKKNSQINQQV